MSKYLFVGAHPDDIELGCAGIIKQLTDKECDVYGLIIGRGRPHDEEENMKRAVKPEEDELSLKYSSFLED